MLLAAARLLGKSQADKQLTAEEIIAQEPISLWSNETLLKYCKARKLPHTLRNAFKQYKIKGKDFLEVDAAVFCNYNKIPDDIVLFQTEQKLLRERDVAPLRISCSIILSPEDAQRLNKLSNAERLGIVSLFKKDVGAHFQVIPYSVDMDSLSVSLDGGGESIECGFLVPMTIPAELRQSIIKRAEMPIRCVMASQALQGGAPIPQPNVVPLPPQSANSTPTHQNHGGTPTHQGSAHGHGAGTPTHRGGTSYMRSSSEPVNETLTCRMVLQSIHSEALRKLTKEKRKELLPAVLADSSRHFGMHNDKLNFSTLMVDWDSIPGTGLITVGVIATVGEAIRMDLRGRTHIPVAYPATAAALDDVGSLSPRHPVANVMSDHTASHHGGSVHGTAPISPSPHPVVPSAAPSVHGNQTTSQVAPIVFSLRFTPQFGQILRQLNPQQRQQVQEVAKHDVYAHLKAAGFGSDVPVQNITVDVSGNSDSIPVSIVVNPATSKDIVAAITARVTIAEIVTPGTCVVLERFSSRQGTEAVTSPKANAATQPPQLPPHPQPTQPQQQPPQMPPSPLSPQSPMSPLSAQNSARPSIFKERTGTTVAHAYTSTSPILPVEMTDSRAPIWLHSSPANQKAAEATSRPSQSGGVLNTTPNQDSTKHRHVDAASPISNDFKPAPQLQGRPEHQDSELEIVPGLIAITEHSIAAYRSLTPTQRSRMVIPAKEDVLQHLIDIQHAIAPGDIMVDVSGPSTIPVEVQLRPGTSQYLRQAIRTRLRQLIAHPTISRYLEDPLLAIPARPIPGDWAQSYLQPTYMMDAYPNTFEETLTCKIPLTESLSMGVGTLDNADRYYLVDSVTQDIFAHFGTLLHTKNSKDVQIDVMSSNDVFTAKIQLPRTLDMSARRLIRQRAEHMIEIPATTRTLRFLSQVARERGVATWRTRTANATNPANYLPAPTPYPVSESVYSTAYSPLKDEYTRATTIRTPYVHENLTDVRLVHSYTEKRTPPRHTTESPCTLDFIYVVPN